MPVASVFAVDRYITITAVRSNYACSYSVFAVARYITIAHSRSKSKW